MNEYYSGENLNLSSGPQVKILVRVRNHKTEKDSRGALQTEESSKSGNYKSNVSIAGSRSTKAAGGRDSSKNWSKSPVKSSK